MTATLILFLAICLPDPEFVPIPSARQPRSLADDPAVHNGRDHGGPHETSHELNSKGRQLYAGYQAVYLLRGRGVVVRNPRTTLGAVAALVPAQYRTDTYQLYFVQQRGGWDDTPLYILDEMGCYLNGMECYAASGDTANSRLSATKAGEFLYYAEILVKVVSRDDPGYDRTQLERVIDYQLRRWREFTKQ